MALYYVFPAPPFSTSIEQSMKASSLLRARHLLPLPTRLAITIMAFAESGGIEWTTVAIKAEMAEETRWQRQCLRILY